MASPPHRAQTQTSPVYSAHIPLPNPKKRPSLSVKSHSSSKRRKPSSMSASTPGISHPLRQTSFPPEESVDDTYARSPSVESDVTGVTGERSVLTAGTGATKGKKRKRGEGSVRSGAKAPGGDEGSASGQVGEDGPEEDEEDGEGEANEGLLDDGEEIDEAAEEKNLALLVEALDSEQAERYNLFRRTKLKKETVRKIVNQTLSQSVPPSVITTISGYTKVFIGLIVERAREVQQQQASPPTSPPPDQSSTQNTLPFSSSSFPDLDDDVMAPESSNLQPSSTGQKKPERDLGPLLPDHLREALRRYKRDGEGGGTGMGGLSLGLGVQGTRVARQGGKRLFM